MGKVVPLVVSRPHYGAPSVWLNPVLCSVSPCCLISNGASRHARDLRPLAHSCVILCSQFQISVAPAFGAVPAPHQPMELLFSYSLVRCSMRCFFGIAAITTLVGCAPYHSKVLYEPSTTTQSATFFPAGSCSDPHYGFGAISNSKNTDVYLSANNVGNRPTLNLWITQGHCTRTS